MKSMHFLQDGSRKKERVDRLFPVDLYFLKEEL